MAAPLIAIAASPTIGIFRFTTETYADTSTYPHHSDWLDQSDWVQSVHPPDWHQSGQTCPTTMHGPRATIRI